MSCAALVSADLSSTNQDSSQNAHAPQSNHSGKSAGAAPTADSAGSRSIQAESFTAAGKNKNGASRQLEIDDGVDLIDQQEDQKIVGGSEVFPKLKYQYMVRAGGCAASLVAPNVLLTAAHYYNAFWRIQIAGRHDVRDNTEDYEEFDFEERVRHPNYNSRTLDYDLMMVKLSGSSTFTPVLLLDESGTNNTFSTEATAVMGWGKTSSNGPSSRVLLEVDVDVKSDSVCKDSYPPWMTDRMFCAAAQQGKDSCQGDSGGPIIDKFTGKQIGVVSWGSGCAQENYPGVYSKVWDQITWIQGYIDDWHCRSIKAKDKYNTTTGCSYHRTKKKCMAAFTTESFVKWNNRRKCRRKGCLFDDQEKTCYGRWD